MRATTTRIRIQTSKYGQFSLAFYFSLFTIKLLRRSLYVAYSWVRVIPVRTFRRQTIDGQQRSTHSTNSASSQSMGFPSCLWWRPFTPAMLTHGPICMLCVCAICVLSSFGTLHSLCTNRAKKYRTQSFAIVVSTHNSWFTQFEFSQSHRTRTLWPMWLMKMKKCTSFRYNPSAAIHICIWGMYMQNLCNHSFYSILNIFHIWPSFSNDCPPHPQQSGVLALLNWTLPWRIQVACTWRINPLAWGVWKTVADAKLCRFLWTDHYYKTGTDVSSGGGGGATTEGFSRSHCDHIKTICAKEIIRLWKYRTMWCGWCGECSTKVSLEWHT